MELIWQDFLKIAEAELGIRAVETWIKAVSFYRYDMAMHKVYLKAPNTFVKDWVQTHYHNLFEVHLKRLLHINVITIHFFVGEDTSQSVVVDSAVEKIIPAIIPKKTRPVQYAPAKKIDSNQMINRLNSSYTFDSFVVGPNNSFAYAAARAVVDKLGKLYNPLLLYGGSGLGKTHLLHSIGNDVLAQNPDAVVLYQTTDRFINEFINAIRFNQMPAFNAKYKQIDVLLIDDIQFMANKDQTQEAFFHIFNSLYDANKQIVFSSDILPRDLGGLADRLRSRLEWGLVADLQVPRLETKIAILKRKAFAQNEVLSDEAANLIARRVISNVRELEGSLIRVLAFASLTNQSVTVDLIGKVLGHEQQSHSVIIEFDAITKVIQKHYFYGLTELRSKNRTKDISLARQITMYLMKQVTNKSLREIGEFLNRKDHTTIAHAIQRIDDLRKLDSELDNRLMNLEKELSLNKVYESN
ncbi:chromosomal replication initiator protein DnaA [Candidatus Babeliales bacterium]|nr:chromosomal replication initiator protein DnaA [Candidatus Babeliales bacterium]MBP9844008.1 chromosomal replication initiator protein DnaA [Candidatus Babeliales bacterium]